MKVAGVRCVVHLYDFSEEEKALLEQKGYENLDEDICENLLYDKCIDYNVSSFDGIPFEVVDQFVEKLEKLENNKAIRKAVLFDEFPYQCPFFTTETVNGETATEEEKQAMYSYEKYMHRYDKKWLAEHELTQLDGVKEQALQNARYPDPDFDKLPDESELLLYFPEKGDIVYMQDGAGDQLDDDDLNVGYNDYIEYKINSYVDGEDLMFEEGDGGCYLYNHDHVTDWKEKIHDCIVEIYGKYIPYVVLPLP